jgi:polyphenol oxidase
MIAPGFEVSPRLTFSSLNFIDYAFGTRHSAPPCGTVTVHQVHSARVVCNRGALHREEDADALIENTPGIAIGIKTADCVPVLLADPVQRAVAAIHAGWRGTAAFIVQAAIRSMAAEFGTRTQDLHATIGPSIGACCYQVGPEVAREFGVIAPWHVHLDLARINISQLAAAGVLAHNISIAGDCTKCKSNEYHSFRRDREASGRMISWIRIRENEV